MFTPASDPDTVLDSSGRVWQVTEEALLGPEGGSKPRVNGHLAYWFGWFSFFPNTLLYGTDELESSQAPEQNEVNQTLSSLEDYGPAPEFLNEVWLNTPGPLRLANLRGQVVLLDMWTFG